MPVSEEIELIEGEFLGDYQILNVLGYGTIGATCHVVDNVMKKEFALKILPVAEEISLEWWSRFEGQLVVLGKLSSRFIDRILGSGKVGSMRFYVKDLVHDGEGIPYNLRQYTQRHGKKLSEFQVYHLVTQILEGLSAAREYKDAHHQGLSHGALKPENILIASTEAGVPFEVRLSDFQPYGLVTPNIIYQTFNKWKQHFSSSTLRLYPETIGNAIQSIYQLYPYKAPEHLSDLEQSPSETGDLFSIGVILYEVLTGEVPEGSFVPIETLRPDIHPSWSNLIEQLLQANPESRFQTCQEMQEFIERELALDFTHQEPIVVAPTPYTVEGKDIKNQPEEKRSITPPGMVYIPAGSFMVGSSECGEDALPQHRCETPGFYIDRFPVTNQQFEKFTLETGFKTEAEEKGEAPTWIQGEWKVLKGIYWNNPTGSALPKDFEKHPVTQLTFRDAKAYAKWLGRRLPTEEEWEFAAQGGRGDIRYPWGNQLSSMFANFSTEGTTPVMRYQPNGYGLYDMAGNVWEWTDSWYKPYQGNLKKDMHFGEKYRVVRGGAWMYDGFHCMLAYRNANAPHICYPTLGLRTAYDFIPSEKEVKT